MTGAEGAKAKEQERCTFLGRIKLTANNSAVARSNVLRMLLRHRPWYNYIDNLRPPSPQSSTDTIVTIDSTESVPTILGAGLQPTRFFQ
jgi:hypothetical protein